MTVLPAWPGNSGKSLDPAKENLLELGQVIQALGEKKRGGELMQELKEEYTNK